MMADIENKLSKRQGIVHLIIGILVFGSIWGLLEATLGGFLHMIIFPNKGAIMARYRRSYHGLGTGHLQKAGYATGYRYHCCLI